MRKLAIAAVLSAALACGREVGSPVQFFAPTVTPMTAVLVGAGDIGECGPGTGAEATARILDRTEGIVFTAGDNSYPRGTMQEFRNCYEPAWGRHKARTRPAPGNHDYETPQGSDYFGYFGSHAGPSSQGYYSFTAGNWTVLSLNSNIPIDRSSAQMAWVQDELASSRNRCAAAYFHHPPFTSSARGNNGYMMDMWRELSESGVDVVIASHEHNYERFAQMDGEGRPDAASGARLFIVGTGGAQLMGFARAAPNSEVRLSQFGVLKLTLSHNSYQWEFLQAVGGIGDSGIGICH